MSVASGTVGAYNASVGSTQAVAETNSDRIRRLIPKHKKCSKCESEMGIPIRQLNRYDKFCPECGTELDEVIGDMWVTVDLSGNTPAYYENIKRSDTDIKEEKDPRMAISLRQLVILLKEYEKEMVIENI